MEGNKTDYSKRRQVRGEEEEERRDELQEQLECVKRPGVMLR
jgi:hypothetical protein